MPGTRPRTVGSQAPARMIRSQAPPRTIEARPTRADRDQDLRIKPEPATRRSVPAPRALLPAARSSVSDPDPSLPAPAAKPREALRPRTCSCSAAAACAAWRTSACSRRCATLGHRVRRDRRHEHRLARRRDGGRRLPARADRVASSTSVQKEDYFRLNFVKFLLKGTCAREHVPRRPLQGAARAHPAADVRFGEMRVPFFCNAVRLETGGIGVLGDARASTTSRSSTRCTPRARCRGSSSRSSAAATTTWTAAWSTPCRCASRRPCAPT